LSATKPRFENSQTSLKQANQNKLANWQVPKQQVTKQQGAELASFRNLTLIEIVVSKDFSLCRIVLLSTCIFINLVFLQQQAKYLTKEQFLGIKL
jgi:hypothetical protein